MPIKRKRITSGAELAAWRAARNLTQEECSVIFHRTLRSYQYLEAEIYKKFPPEVDDAAQLYDLQKRKKKKGAATA